jgi:uncharacterized protein YaiI (UPF0178 family)
VRIHVDADGCPVKAEVYRVAKRYGLRVFVVANSWMDTPSDPLVEMVTVSDGLDAADNWIAEHAEAQDVVVTTDIPLAARCVAKGAAVLHPTGRRFSEGDIGAALAMRELLKSLRESGVSTGGPAPFQDRDRSQFLQALDTAVQRHGGRRQRDERPGNSAPNPGSAG